MENKRFYHEINLQERFDLYNRRLQWGKISQKYLRPNWCGDESALTGLFGCEKLISGFVKISAHCMDCKFYQGEKNE